MSWRRPPASMQALNAPPYDVFYMDYEDSEHPDPWDTVLSMIIRRDDVDALTEYLSLHPFRLKGPGVVQDLNGTVFPDAFEYAATWGAIKVLRSLLDYESIHPQQNFRFGFGAKGYGLLNLACHHGQLETVRYLLNVSQDVAGDLRFRDGDGWTPLLAAADAMADKSKLEKYHRGLAVTSYTGRYEEIMELLLDKGALADDVRECKFWRRGDHFVGPGRRMRWAEGYTEEELLAGSEALDLRPVPEDETVGESLLYFMLPEDHIVSQGVATFSTLLQSCDREDVDARATTNHHTPLYAILSSLFIRHNPSQQALRARVARMLVEHGADPALKMSNGRNALHALASSFANLADDQCAEDELIALFLSHGVSIDDADNSGDTALHVAARDCRRPAAVRTLLRYGATPEVDNKAGDTPLHIAAAMTTAFRMEGLDFKQAVEMQDEVLQLLVEAASSHGGSPMERRNASGKTPLEIKYESREKVKKDLAPPIWSPGWGRGRGR
ncbi:ankyrin repeat-containing domain protein [Pestalotiopsis sp. NC0098]|nr:ankyrin repeat-containing domain protein [Pestalotiopsis sp. NC0098]